jgi:hypothetical protein
MQHQRLDSIMRRQRRTLVQDVVFALAVSGALAASIAALNGM